MDKYYVYAHAKPDGEVFYVGKGCGNRLFTTGNRSAFWKRIVAKYEYTAILLEECLTESAAYEREVFWIGHYKKIGQCVANFTLGGDGVRVERRWWNHKIGAALKGKKYGRGNASKAYKDYISKEDLERMYVTDQMSSVAISKLCGFSYATVCARLKEYGIPTRSPGKAKRTIVCVSDGNQFSSISDAARFYKLKRELIGKVLNGRYKTTGGLVFSYKGICYE